MSYVRWWMQENNLNKFINIFDDEIELYYFKKFIENNSQKKFVLEELTQVLQLMQIISTWIPKDISLIDESLMDRYNWKEIQPEITSIVNSREIQSLHSFLQMFRAKIYLFPVISISNPVNNILAEYLVQKYLLRIKGSGYNGVNMGVLNWESWYWSMEPIIDG
ncbi:hypothetical protein RF11_09464 [Thelohanellus kitauei]|uniref:Uncharacterized protein n=1 Tax=Thelohanellus kitauei TaxID=669202 RepID=A0A0C2I5Y7_THEKT|nr:hypothetical protein RF11_09464 [Thelohanellus kitauei]